jgi:hypothetical protein
MFPPFLWGHHHRTNTDFSFLVCNRSFIRRFLILQDQVQYRSSWYPRKWLGMACQGQRDWSSPNSNICQSGPSCWQIHSTVGHWCLGACVLFAIPEQKGRVLWCYLGCYQLEDGRTETSMRDELGLWRWEDCKVACKHEIGTFSNRECCGMMSCKGTFLSNMANKSRHNCIAAHYVRHHRLYSTRHHSYSGCRHLNGQGWIRTECFLGWFRYSEKRGLTHWQLLKPSWSYNPILSGIVDAVLALVLVHSSLLRCSLSYPPLISDLKPFSTYDSSAVTPARRASPFCLQPYGTMTSTLIDIAIT